MRLWRAVVAWMRWRQERRLLDSLGPAREHIATRFALLDRRDD